MSRIDRYGKLLFGKYYIGRFRGEDVVHETVYGFVKSGYWYAGGPENKPYDHLFYGVVWGWNWNFGIGLIRATEPINQPSIVEEHTALSQEIAKDLGEEY